jgi:DNA-binding response OmpR family regulator
MRLLLVEDNERLGPLLKRGLVAAGFDVDLLATAGDAAAALRAADFEIVVLDRALPDGDGLDVLVEMRQRRVVTPVLILTAYGSIKDRVASFKTGADDYLVKPFALAELVERLRALLRRPRYPVGLRLTLGNLTLDTVDRQVYVNERPIVFPPQEITLLERLLRRAGQQVPKSLLEMNPHGHPVSPNAIQVYVHRLRKRLAKIGAAVNIHTVPGTGYVITHQKQFDPMACG